MDAATIHVQVKPKPFLKWAGGKTKLLPIMEPLFPGDFGTYFEPFLGAGAVFFHLANEGRIKHAFLSDINQDLVNAFMKVRNVPGDLVRHLEELKEDHCSDSYYEARLRFNSGFMTQTVRAAHFIYLNKTCFNGLYRVNSQGDFNSPFGCYKNPKICDEAMLHAVSQTLRRTSASVMPLDFAVTMKSAIKGDFIYLDPPYVPLSETENFTAYDAEGFALKEHERLAAAFRSADKRGVLLMATNHDTPLVRRLYAGFKLTKAQVQRSINSDASARKAGAPELIIRNYE